jgi:hypothetical protein
MSNKGLSFSSTDPAAPTGFQNVTFMTDLSNPVKPKISAYTQSLDGAEIQSVPGVGSGWSVSSQIALTNSVVVIKNSAGNFGGYMLHNQNATPVYIQLFDLPDPDLTVTLGDTVPKYVIPLPAGAAANVEWSLGITHDVSIKAAATTTPTGAVAPSISLVGFFIYK